MLMKRVILDITDLVNHFAPAEHFANWADEPYALFFDSADQTHPDSRYSFIAINPIETIEFDGKNIHVHNEQQHTKTSSNPFTALKDRLHHWVQIFDILPPCDIPFTGGAAGLFGYDLARSIETLPNLAPQDMDTPHMAIGIYTSVIAYNHETQKIDLIIHDDEKNAATKRDDILRNLNEKRRQKRNQDTSMIWKAQGSKESYKKKVQAVIDYIYQGDIFQANLSQRFCAQMPDNFDHYAHYSHMRRQNAAPFSCYFNMGKTQISSVSPERFLRVKGKHVQTKPIKGTAPKYDKPALNQQSQNTLLNSEKDHAENIMIVDLLRNDLSKSCTPDSVMVTKLCALESFSHVHHLVSTIEGQLQNNKDAIDLLHGAFPGGSITGAPKIRAMEIIDELELTRRGPYTGSIGYIDFSGHMDMNILIRTLIYNQGKAYLSVGGGITAASKPEAEHQETLDKAQGIFASFETQHEDLKKAS